MFRLPVLRRFGLPIIRRNNSSLSSSDLVWHTEGKKKTISDTSVLVCGWAGSKRANVEKYTDLFAKNFGLDSFGCILPMADFMSFDHSAQSVFTRQVLNQVSQLQPSKERKVNLILLCLSNNGATVYQHIVRQCADQNLFAEKFSIAGAIFDSGPGINFLFITVFHLGFWKPKCCWRNIFSNTNIKQSCIMIIFLFLFNFIKHFLIPFSHLLQN